MKTKTLYALVIQAGGSIQALLWSILDFSLAKMLRLPHHHNQEHLGRPAANPGGLVAIGQPSTPFFSDGELWRPLAFAGGMPEYQDVYEVPSPSRSGAGTMIQIHDPPAILISNGRRWLQLLTYDITALEPPQPDPNQPTEERSNGNKQEPIRC